MQSNIKTLCVAVLMLITAPSMSFAEGSSWYVGGEVGQSDFSLELPSGYSASSPGVQQDKTDNSYAIYAGYSFNSYLSGEVGYVDLGKYSVKTANGDSASAKLQGMTINAIWKLPLNAQWTLFAKTGLIATRGSAEARVSGIGYQQSKSVWEPVVGLGVDFALDKHWTLRGQYQDVGAASVAEAVGTTVKLSDSLLSIGVIYGF